MAQAQEISVYQLTRLIEELLFVHDCVIVPGFGGFVGKTVPASFDSEEGLFLPPGKRIAFNGQLTHNDGLLVAALANKYQLKFEAADARVQAFCQEVRTLLLRDKRLIFGRIGSFMQAGSAQLFEPSHDINFLLSSFGLPSLRVQAAEKSSVQDLPAVTQETVLHPGTKSGNGVLRYLASAVSIPAAVLVLAWPFIHPAQKQNGNNTAGNPFSESTPVVSYTPRKTASFPAFTDTLAALPPVSQLIAAEKQTHLPAMPVSTAVETLQPESASDTGNFSLIAGCFKSEENAAKLVEELQQKGFDARIAGQNSAGLIRVSMGSAGSRNALQDIYSKALAQGYSVWWLHQ